VKYLDYSSLLSGRGVDLALFSTFQFDPDFFERRLLRSEGLNGARRIVILMDGSQWSGLRGREAPARWLNRRYLVAPVFQPSGVFHPKLTLLISGTGGQVLCGSNNLTRAGCSSNLELLNVVPYEVADPDSEGALLAREAFAFFQHAKDQITEPLRRIVTSWIEEVAQAQPWLTSPSKGSSTRRIALVHSYSGSLWEQVEAHLSERSPRAFFVMAPFHDSRADSCRRLARRWPRASIELAVQQGYTNLQAESLRKLASVHLTEVVSSSRRLHAKLMAWRDSKRWGCLVGSANFTRAALEGPNTEACLLISEIEDPCSTLFDEQLKRRPIALDDFEPGPAEDSENEALKVERLRIDAAVLTAGNRLELCYSNDLGRTATALRLEIRTPVETRPRASVPLRIASRATDVAALPEGCLDEPHGIVLAMLSATVGDTIIRSAPVWIVQERHLTFEAAVATQSKRHQVEETGEGLTEVLDEIGASQGVHGVVEYLQHLSIRFYDGSEGIVGPRPFRIAPRDPFVDDRLPDWILALREPTSTLEETICDFVDRHERLRLHKHADRGNINGMPNFVDIFTTLTRLMLVYYRRGVVKRRRLIARYCNLIAVATDGRHTEEEEFKGYLSSTFVNIGRDCALLQEACDETGYLSKLRAALLIVQNIRSELEPKVDGGERPARPRDMLSVWAGLVGSTIRGCCLAEPQIEKVRQALIRYGIRNTGEVFRLLSELPK
jgi:hypothetical protein